MESSFKDFLLNIPDYSQKKYLLLVSGGVDSMVLLYLFLKLLPQNLAVLHLNYQLRQEESDNQENLVKNFCNSHNIPCFIFKEKISSTQNIQLKARELRFKRAREVKNKYKYDYLATAHHQDDLIETFLMRLFKGTGLEGAVSFQEQNQKTIRPLLPFSKKQIYFYAQKEKIPFIEDSSNFSDKYLRNKIRNKLIPLITEIFPSFSSKIINFLSDLKELLELKNTLLENIPFIQKEEKIIFSKKTFLSLSPYLQKEFLRKMYQKLKGSTLKLKRINLENAIKFINNNHKGIFQFPSGLILFSNLDKIILQKKENHSLIPEEKIKIEVNAKVELKNISLTIKETICHQLDEKFFSKKEVTPPFYLEKREGGEKVNRKSGKKLKIYLNKAKINPYLRKDLWILKDYSNKVIWCQYLGFFHNEETQKKSKEGYLIEINEKN